MVLVQNTWSTHWRDIPQESCLLCSAPIWTEGDGVDEITDLESVGVHVSVGYTEPVQVQMNIHTNMLHLLKDVSSPCLMMSTGYRRRGLGGVSLSSVCSDAEWTPRWMGQLRSMLLQEQPEEGQPEGPVWAARLPQMSAMMRLVGLSWHRDSLEGLLYNQWYTGLPYHNVWYIDHTVCSVPRQI